MQQPEYQARHPTITPISNPLASSIAQQILAESVTIPKSMQPSPPPSSIFPESSIPLLNNNLVPILPEFDIALEQTNESNLITNEDFFKIEAPNILQPHTGSAEDGAPDGKGAKKKASRSPGISPNVTPKTGQTSPARERVGKSTSPSRGYKIPKRVNASMSQGLSQQGLSQGLPVSSDKPATFVERNSTPIERKPIRNNGDRLSNESEVKTPNENDKPSLDSALNSVVNTPILATPKTKKKKKPETDDLDLMESPKKKAKISSPKKDREPKASEADSSRGGTSESQSPKRPRKKSDKSDKGSPSLKTPKKKMKPTKELDAISATLADSPKRKKVEAEDNNHYIPIKPLERTSKKTKKKNKE
eukprot:Platyproteum_vivax@DN3924_c0_g1_i1.p1